MSTRDAKKSKIGRPPIDSQAVNVRLERSVLGDLDNWRKGQDDLPGRPEAIRRLMTKAIAGVTEGSLADLVRARANEMFKEWLDNEPGDEFTLELQKRWNSLSDDEIVEFIGNQVLYKIENIGADIQKERRRSSKRARKPSGG